MAERPLVALPVTDRFNFRPGLVDEAKMQKWAALLEMHNRLKAPTWGETYQQIFVDPKTKEPSIRTGIITLSYLVQAAVRDLITR